MQVFSFPDSKIFPKITLKSFLLSSQINFFPHNAVDRLNVDCNDTNISKLAQTDSYKVISSGLATVF